MLVNAADSFFTLPTASAGMGIAIFGLNDADHTSTRLASSGVDSEQLAVKRAV